jgi:hypothetical protein
MASPIMPKSLLSRAFIGVLLAATAAAPPPARAQAAPQAEQQEPGALAREAIDKLMRALSLAIENLPQYAMPELNENGDIIIRRINPRAEKPRPTAPKNPDETRT